MMPAAIERGNAEGVLAHYLFDDTGLTEQGKGRDVDVIALMRSRNSRKLTRARRRRLSCGSSAEVLKVSAVTVARDWSAARAWLHREMSRGTSDGR
jgi:ECF sigma factor